MKSFSLFIAVAALCASTLVHANGDDYQLDAFMSAYDNQEQIQKRRPNSIQVSRTISAVFDMVDPREISPCSDEGCDELIEVTADELLSNGRIQSTFSDNMSIEERREQIETIVAVRIANQDDNEEEFQDRAAVELLKDDLLNIPGNREIHEIKDININ